MQVRSLRWIAGLGLAGIVHVGLFWVVVILQAPQRKSTATPGRHTTFEYMKAGKAADSPLLAEQIELFDSRPLLLPTRWNASNGEFIKKYIDDEREIFEDFRPQFRAGDGDFVGSYGNQWSRVESVLSAQVAFDAGVLDGLGRRSEPLPTFNRDGFEVSVVEPSTGEELISERVFNNEARQLLLEEWADWKPAQFMVSVEDSFVLQEMMVVRSSGSSAADELLRDVARSGLRQRGALEDGSYLVKIGL